MQAHGTITRHRVIGHNVTIEPMGRGYSYVTESNECCEIPIWGYRDTVRECLQAAVYDIRRNHA